MRIERSETMCINKYENWDCSDYYWPLSLNLVALYIVYKVKTAERLKCCGMKGRTVVAHGYQKTKKLVCGMEGENVVAYGRLPPPPPRYIQIKHTWYFARRGGGLGGYHGRLMKWVVSIIAETDSLTLGNGRFL